MTGYPGQTSATRCSGSCGSRWTGCTGRESRTARGAIEAALVAGLTAVGMQAGPAVSAALLYRLATYWLPIAPGWLSWRALLRRDYV